MASCPGTGVAAPVRHLATTSHDIKFLLAPHLFLQNIIYLASYNQPVSLQALWIPESLRTFSIPGIGIYSLHRHWSS